MHANAKHSLIYISIFIVGLTVVNYLLESPTWSYWIGFTLGAITQSAKASIVKEEKKLTNA